MQHPEFKKLRVLLMQIRDEARVRAEELDSFAKYSGLERDQINVLNVFDTPKFLPTIAHEYDALFVGGASEASVLEPERYVFIAPAIALLKRCIADEIPVFASCFGFQLAILALGGKIDRNETEFEMGTLAIQLSDTAHQDPIFQTTAEACKKKNITHFFAVSVHKESAQQIPSGCELLAYTDTCVHAFRVQDKPFWAFQFHPELDKPTLIERLTIFSKGYTESSRHLHEIIASLVDTPQANRLPAHFVNNVLLPHA